MFGQEVGAGLGNLITFVASCLQRSAYLGTSPGRTAISGEPDFLGKVAGALATSPGTLSTERADSSFLKWLEVKASS